MEKLEELLKIASSHVSDNQQNSISLEVAAKLSELIISGAAKMAEESSRSFSDGDGASGCKAAANAVKYYGEQLLK